MSSGHPHHLAQHRQATPSFPGNISSSPRCPQERKREQLCTLKDIRAESKGSSKLPPQSGNSLPQNSAGPSDTPHSTLRYGLLESLGCFSQKKVLMERGQEKDRAPSPGRGAVSLVAGHEGTSSAHSHHTSSPQRGPPGPEDNPVLSPGVVSAPAALQSAHSSITPASRGHLTSALGLDCYLHAPDALCRARGCRAASHFLTTLCHSQQPSLWLLMRPVPCTQSLHQLHPLHL